MIPITPQLFEAYLKCPTKSFLLSIGETGSGNPYAEWICTQNILYAREGIKRLKEEVSNIVSGAIDRAGLKSRLWQLATETKVCTQNLESTLHALERVPSGIVGKPAQFIPTRFIFANKLGRVASLG